MYPSQYKPYAYIFSPEGPHVGGRLPAAGYDYQLPNNRPTTMTARFPSVVVAPSPLLLPATNPSGWYCQPSQSTAAYTDAAAKIESNSSYPPPPSQNDYFLDGGERFNTF